MSECHFPLELGDEKWTNAAIGQELNPQPKPDISLAGGLISCFGLRSNAQSPPSLAGGIGFKSCDQITAAIFQPVSVRTICQLSLPQFCLWLPTMKL